MKKHDQLSGSSPVQLQDCNPISCKLNTVICKAPDTTVQVDLRCTRQNCPKEFYYLFGFYIINLNVSLLLPTLFFFGFLLFVNKKSKNKEERFSRVPRLSDIRYSAKGIKGRWRYASNKARL